MDRELVAALKDLGLSPTESSVYVALLEHCGDGPVSAYRLAQEMGRDPANMTKALASAVKRGAATVTGKRPRLYAPTAPQEFIDSLVAHLQGRRQQAIDLLETVGTPPPDDGRPHPLDEHDEALVVGRRLIGDAERVVLVNAAPEWLSLIQDDLDRAAADQGAMVIVRATELVTAPGPWLRLVVDGRLCLNVVSRLESDELLFGEWSTNPARAFLQHRELAQAAVLDDLVELLDSGAATAAVKRRADEQLPQLLASVPWKRRWQDAGLPPYTPTPPASESPSSTTPSEPLVAPSPAPEPIVAAEPALEVDVQETEELDPATVAEAMAEVAAEFTPETPGATEPDPDPAEDEDSDDDGGGPLRFIFRRRKND